MFAADAVGKVFDGQVTGVERDALRLAEAMPADKYNFAPTTGSFTGVRTFAIQTRHIATMLYILASAISGEKPPVDIGVNGGPDLNGPDSVRTKEQIVAYLKGSIEFAHKAALTVTAQNELEPVKTMFGPTMPRMAAASMMGSHSMDHYGQMVVYARMNGVVPPASQPQPASGSGSR